jgi:APA family basic amino acid/polyamine antiporter
MIFGLPKETQLSALGWMVLGLLVYFGYSKANSKLKE